MPVMTPEKKWTDDRLEGLEKKVDDGFDRVDTSIRELKGEMNERFEKVDTKIDTLDAKFDKKFDRLTWILLAGALGIIAAILGNPF